MLHMISLVNVIRYVTNPDVIRDLVKEYVPRLTFSLNPVPQLVLRTTGPVSDALTFLEKNLPRLLN